MLRTYSREEPLVVYLLNRTQRVTSQRDVYAAARFQPARDRLGARQRQAARATRTCTCSTRWERPTRSSDQRRNRTRSATRSGVGAWSFARRRSRRYAPRRSSAGCCGAGSSGGCALTRASVTALSILALPREAACSTTAVQPRASGMFALARSPRCRIVSDATYSEAPDPCSALN